MTINELLVMLGRAWARLLIYPGGLTCFGLIWLLTILRGRAHFTWTGTRRWGLLEISAVVLPWLAIALLPVPRAAGLSRSIDIVVVLALLEWPMMLTIMREINTNDTALEQQVVRRLAGILNGYPLLILATLVLVEASGSFDLRMLLRPPGELAPPYAVIMYWLGATTWLLVLPPLLGLGPFAMGEAASPALWIGLQFRSIGLVTLATLPWLALPDGWEALLPLPPLLIVAALWGYTHITAGQALRRWAYVYLYLDGLLLLVLLWDAALALQRRLL